MSLIILSVDDSSTPAVDPLPPGTEAWARELVSAQFLQAWPVEIAAILVGGSPIVAPAYLDGETQPSAKYFACCSYQALGSRQATQGQHPLIEYRANAWIKIWSPSVDDGRGNASKLVDAARRVFTRKQLTSSAYVAPLQLQTANAAQAYDDGARLMQAVAFPLTYWEQQ